MTNKIKLWKLATVTSVIMASTSINAALIERLGGLAYYDDVADLTWLADANYANTSGFENSGANGRFQSWQDANDWAAGLIIGDVGGWRLADTLQPDSSCDGQIGSVSYGSNCTGSEMGSLFYTALGNTAGALTNTGPFINVLPLADNYYWSATEFSEDPLRAWAFSMGSGDQDVTAKNTSFYYGWAVQSGDVSAVPAPAAVWLFGSGVLGLIGVARRKKS